MIFTVEYLIRFFCANSISYEVLGEPQLEQNIKSIDILPIVPAYADMFANKQNRNRNISDNQPFGESKNTCDKKFNTDANLQNSTYNNCQIRMHKTWLFFIQAYNLIDFFAILPFYISIITNGSSSQFSFIRILRLARVFRVFKLGKYSEGAFMYAQVFKKSAEVLYLLLFFSLMISVFMGSMIYFFERGEWNPDGCYEYISSVPQNITRGCFMRSKIISGEGKEESPYYSIPQSIWWVVSTITTVGYGDIYPTSFGGKIIALITMHIGLLGLALPITVIGSNFRELFNARQHHKQQMKLYNQMKNINSLDLVEQMQLNLDNITSECQQLRLSIAFYGRLRTNGGSPKNIPRSSSLNLDLRENAENVHTQYTTDNPTVDVYQLLQMRRSLTLMSDTITSALLAKDIQDNNAKEDEKNINTKKITEKKRGFDSLINDDDCTDTVIFEYEKIRGKTEKEPID